MEPSLKGGTVCRLCVCLCVELACRARSHCGTGFFGERPQQPACLRGLLYLV